MVAPMLGHVFWADGKIPEGADTAIKVATSVGTVIGQLGFGAMADVIGRRQIYGFELIVMIFATLAQALATGSYSISFVGLMVFWRVIMGIGECSRIFAASSSNILKELVVTTRSVRSSHPSLLQRNGVVQ